MSLHPGNWHNNSGKRQTPASSRGLSKSDVEQEKLNQNKEIQDRGCYFT